MKKPPPKPAKLPGHLPPPPPELEQAGRELWISFTAEFVVDDAGSQMVLKEVCMAADMVAACREQIARDGLTIPTRSGGVRDHPLIRAVLMTQSFMTRSLIRLGAIADASKPRSHKKTPGLSSMGAGSNWSPSLDPNRRQCFTLEPTAEVASSRRNSASYVVLHYLPHQLLDDRPRHTLQRSEARCRGSVASTVGRVQRFKDAIA
jgi:hypothetical protein